MTASDFEPVGDYGETDFDAEEIVIVKDEFGRAALVPRSLRKLDTERRALVSELMKSAEAVRVAQSRVEELVDACRQESLSWESIGWAVGTTGNAARQRWGVGPD